MLTQNQSTYRVAAAAALALMATAVSEHRPGAQVPPATWTAADVGSPAIRGSAQSNQNCSPGTGCPLFVVTGAGEGIGGASDQFTFLHQRLTGDGVVRMRLLSMAGPAGAEIGLTFRESLNGNSRHGSFMAGAGVALRRRTTTGGTSAVTVGPRPSGPFWMKLERAGSTLTASTSPDGSQWSVIGTQTVAMQPILYVGIAATSRAPGTPATAMVSSMAVATTTPTLPDGWSSADVGRAPSSGAASYSDSTFLGVSSAPGVRRSADAFRFVYYRIRGDVRLVARVAASQGGVGRQAGIMLRNTLDPGSIQEALLLDDVGIALVKRAAAGGSATNTRVASRVPPVWLRLERSGLMVTSSYSSDGRTWQAVATDTLPLAAELYVGLAASGGPSESRAAAAFDQVSLVSIAANKPPVVSLVTPDLVAVLRAGDPVAITASASDPDDRVVRVEFRVNGDLVGSDDTAPYAATWQAGPIGHFYFITAVAFDDDGGATTSAAAMIVTRTWDGPMPPSGDGNHGDGGDRPDPPLPRGWHLLFEASFNHPWLDHYVLDIYVADTRTLVFSRNLGKPDVGNEWLITVDVDETVKGLPAGEYEVIVTAVEGAERAASLPFYIRR